jgi:hypothetical protein
VNGAGAVHAGTVGLAGHRPGQASLTLAGAPPVACPVLVGLSGWPYKPGGRECLPQEAW